MSTGLLNPESLNTTNAGEILEYYAFLEFSFPGFLSYLSFILPRCVVRLGVDSVPRVKGTVVRIRCWAQPVTVMSSDY